MKINSPTKCGFSGGISEIYLIPLDDVQYFPEPDTSYGVTDNGDGTLTMKFGWEEIVTEDADFEIIDPKQLPDVDPHLPRL